MQVDLPWELWDSLPLDNELLRTVAILDTNVLLRYLPLLRSLVNLLSDTSNLLARPPPFLCVPHIVLSELDGLKHSQVMTQSSALVPLDSSDSYHSPRKRSTESSLGGLSRAASNWLLSVFPSSDTPLTDPVLVRGQRFHESLIPRVNGRRPAESNDAQVLDVCLYFRKNFEMSTRVVLLSNDRNLCLTARTEGVDTVETHERMTTKDFLKKIDPAFAVLLENASTPLKYSLPISPPRTPPPPVARRTASDHQPPSTTPRTLTASQPSRKLTPIPLSREPDPMELDPSLPLPPLVDLPPPLPRQVHSPSHVFLNLCDLLAHFLSLPVYRHVLNHLQTTAASSRGNWQDELGDWRLWEAKDVVDFIKKWWSEGNLEAVCLKGLELQVSNPPPSRLPLPTPPPPKPTSVARDTYSSRWATSSRPSQTDPSYSRPTPPSPRPQIKSSPSQRPRPPPAKRLQEFHSSLPSLIVTLSAPSETANTWSASRYEVLLEQVAHLLTSVLGGVYGGALEEVVRDVARGWAKELVSVGVKVDVELL